MTRPTRLDQKRVIPRGAAIYASVTLGANASDYAGGYASASASDYAGDQTAQTASETRRAGSKSNHSLINRVTEKAIRKAANKEVL